MIQVLHVTIPGVPQPWRRSGGRGVIRFEKPEQRSAKAFIRDCAREGLAKYDESEIPWDTERIMRVRVECYWKCSHPLKKSIRPAKWRPKRPDIDNLIKLVMDSLEGLVWSDDAQIVEVEAIKVHAVQGENPRTEVYVATIPNEEI